MDSGDLFQQFDEIEKRVEKLIGICSSLEAYRQELLEKIAKLEQEIKEKEDAEKRHIDEKQLIRSKIDNLLSRLDKIGQQ